MFWWVCKSPGLVVPRTDSALLVLLKAIWKGTGSALIKISFAAPSSPICFKLFGANSAAFGGQYLSWFFFLSRGHVWLSNYIKPQYLFLFLTLALSKYIYPWPSYEFYDSYGNPCYPSNGIQSILALASLSFMPNKPPALREKGKKFTASFVFNSAIYSKPTRVIIRD